MLQSEITPSFVEIRAAYLSSVFEFYSLPRVTVTLLPRRRDKGEKKRKEEKRGEERRGKERKGKEKSRF